ncbi:MAG: hypothetical protein U0939_13740 [Pirellulales bacterium]
MAHEALVATDGGERTHGVLVARSRASTIAAVIKRVIKGAIAAFLPVLLTTGCAPFVLLHDQLQYTVAVDEFITGMHGRAAAGEAWRRYLADCGDPPDKRDFEAGFRAGYVNISRGENGCRPPLPPRSYWGAKFENPEGRNRIAAWFAGFDQGVIAAEEEGAGAFRRLPPTTRLVAPPPGESSPETLEGLTPSPAPSPSDLPPPYPDETPRESPDQERTSERFGETP